MRENYSPFVERMILHYEGGYGWDAGDPGGPTKYGITCFDLAEYYHEKMDSMQAWAPRVKAMSLSVADEIYRTKYATKCAFDALNSGCDCVVFDFGVNSGPSRAIKFSQRIVGTNQDGILGPITLKAINNWDAAAFVNALCNARLTFLRGLGTWGRFGRGWAARIKDLRAYSLTLTKPLAAAMTDASLVHEPEPKPRRIMLAFAKGDTDVASV